MKWFDDLHELSKALNKLFAELNEKIKKYEPHVREIVDALPKIADFFENYRNDLIEKHRKENLIVPPAFLNLTAPEFFTAYEKSKSKKIIDIYAEHFNDQNNLQKLMERWFMIEEFKIREEIISDAINAHMNGKYTLSIPVLLQQFEGIFCELINKKSKVLKNQDVKRLMKTSNSDSDFLIFSDFFKKVDQEILKHGTKSTDINVFRHQIAHGSDPRYHKVPNASVVCIILLDVLSSKDFKKIVKSPKSAV
jgi:hypothetical protein